MDLECFGGVLDVGDLRKCIWGSILTKFCYKFGKIVNVSISLLWCRYQHYYNDKWHGTWLNDGGVLNQQLIHHLDILRWIFGPINLVNCITTKRLNKLQAEDTAAAIVKFTNGSLCTIEATTAARPIDLHASMSVVGEKGTAVISGVAMNKVKTWKFKNQTDLMENKIKKTYSKNVPTDTPPKISFNCFVRTLNLRNISSMSCFDVILKASGDVHA